MIRWVLLFLAISIIAGLLGFTGLQHAAAQVAKIIFFVFLGLFVIALLLTLLRI